MERIGDAPALAFGRDKQDGIDRLLVGLHGWSHSQSDPASAGIASVRFGLVRSWLRWPEGWLSLLPGLRPGR